MEAAKPAIRVRQEGERDGIACLGNMRARVRGVAIVKMPQTRCSLRSIVRRWHTHTTHFCRSAQRVNWLFGTSKCTLLYRPALTRPSVRPGDAVRWDVYIPSRMKHLKEKATKKIYISSKM